jgi:hypothetical protein
MTDEALEAELEEWMYAKWAITGFSSRAIARVLKRPLHKVRGIIQSFHPRKITFE